MHINILFLTIFYFSIFLHLFSTVASDAASYCNETNGNMYNSRCFKVMNTGPMNWKDAYKACKAEGNAQNLTGKLAFIQNKPLWNNLSSYLQHEMPVNIWTGGKTNESGSLCCWSWMNSTIDEGPDIKDTLLNSINFNLTNVGNECLQIQDVNGWCDAGCNDLYSNRLCEWSDKRGDGDDETTTSIAATSTSTSVKTSATFGFSSFSAIQSTSKSSLTIGFTTGDYSSTTYISTTPISTYSNSISSSPRETTPYQNLVSIGLFKTIIGTDATSPSPENVPTTSVNLFTTTHINSSTVVSTVFDRSSSITTSEQGSTDANISILSSTTTAHSVYISTSSLSDSSLTRTSDVPTPTQSNSASGGYYTNSTTATTTNKLLTPELTNPSTFSSLQTFKASSDNTITTDFTAKTMETNANQFSTTFNASFPTSWAANNISSNSVNYSTTTSSISTSTLNAHPTSYVLTPSQSYSMTGGNHTSSGTGISTTNILHTTELTFSSAFGSLQTSNANSNSSLNSDSTFNTGLTDKTAETSSTATNFNANSTESGSNHCSICTLSYHITSSATSSMSVEPVTDDSTSSPKITTGTTTTSTTKETFTMELTNPSTFNSSQTLVASSDRTTSSNITVLTDLSAKTTVTSSNPYTTSFSTSYPMSLTATDIILTETSPFIIYTSSASTSTLATLPAHEEIFISTALDKLSTNDLTNSPSIMTITNSSNIILTTPYTITSGIFSISAETGTETHSTNRSTVISGISKTNTAKSNDFTAASSTVLPTKLSTTIEENQFSPSSIQNTSISLPSISSQSATISTPTIDIGSHSLMADKQTFEASPESASTSFFTLSTNLFGNVSTISAIDEESTTSQSTSSRNTLPVVQFLSTRNANSDDDTSSSVVTNQPSPMSAMVPLYTNSISVLPLSVISTETSETSDEKHLVSLTESLTTATNISLTSKLMTVETSTQPTPTIVSTTINTTLNTTDSKFPSTTDIDAVPTTKSTFSNDAVEESVPSDTTILMLNSTISSNMSQGISEYNSFATSSFPILSTSYLPPNILSTNLFQSSKNITTAVMSSTISSLQETTYSTEFNLDVQPSGSDAINILPIKFVDTDFTNRETYPLVSTLYFTERLNTALPDLSVPSTEYSAVSTIEQFYSSNYLATTQMQLELNVFPDLIEASLPSSSTYSTDIIDSDSFVTNLNYESSEFQKSTEFILNSNSVAGPTTVFIEPSTEMTDNYIMIFTTDPPVELNTASKLAKLANLEKLAKLAKQTHSNLKSFLETNTSYLFQQTPSSLELPSTLLESTLISQQPHSTSFELISSSLDPLLHSFELTSVAQESPSTSLESPSTLLQPPSSPLESSPTSVESTTSYLKPTTSSYKLISSSPETPSASLESASISLEQLSSSISQKHPSLFSELILSTHVKTLTSFDPTSASVEVDPTTTFIQFEATTNFIAPLSPSYDINAAQSTTTKPQKKEQVSALEKLVKRLIQSLGCSYIMGILASIVLIFQLVLRNNTFDRLLHLAQEFALFLAHLDLVLFYDSTENNILCMSSAIFLQLCFTTFFMFQAIEAVHIFCSLTHTFHIGKLFFGEVWAVGFGAPFILTAICALAYHEQYPGEFTCWLNLDSVAAKVVYVPLIVIISFTVVLLEASAIEKKTHLKRLDRSRYNTTLINHGSLAMLLPSNLIAMVLGQVTMYSQNFALLTITFGFNIANACAILMFHALGNCKFRKLVKNVVRRIKKKFF